VSIASQTERPRGSNASARLTPKSFFGRNGALSKAHPNYEHRPGQIDMAVAVAEALADHKHLIVEAGTGTGKTLAYLVPSILANKRVVISTGTKALQEQLFFKDLPFLQSMFAEPIRACYMKGRQNYLCRQKLYDAEREPILTGMEERKEFQIIRDWEKTTLTGDRSELRDLPEASSAWWKMDARSDNCSGQKCKQFDRCFITGMHAKAVASDIVVVNHHLFFADLAARDRAFGAILPDYDAVIFDEAHEIEDIAGQYFGLSISNLQIHELIKDIAAVSRRKLFATPELDRGLIQMGDRCDQFFALFPREGRQGFRNHKQFLHANEALYSELMLALKTVCARLELVLNAVEDTLPLVRRAQLLQQGLRYWLETPDPAKV
jgi:ATP-dependent DNA helicase DinG